MSFTASTVRRVLYEGGPARFLYSIGNTQARAVLPAGQGPLDGTIRVLLIGCGDIRNVLVTAAALPQLCGVYSAGAPSKPQQQQQQKQQQQKQQQQTEIHINDLSDVILARAVVLLVRSIACHIHMCCEWARMLLTTPWALTVTHLCMTLTHTPTTCAHPVVNAVHCWEHHALLLLLLLLHQLVLQVIASSIDPTSPDDLQFLWCVWFNAALSQTHRQRLDTLLQQVLGGQLPASIVLADPPKQGRDTSSSRCCDSGSSSAAGSGPQTLTKRLQAIWKAWLGCSKSCQVLGAERRTFMLDNYNRRRQALGGSEPHSWQDFVRFNSMEIVLDRVVQDYRSLKDSAKDAMQAELQVYMEHGSILESGVPCQGPSVNPSMLDELCTWRVHDSCWPFDCFPPLNQEQINRGVTGIKGALTQSAQAALRGMVLNFQQAAGCAPTSSSGSSGGDIKFVLHGGDGVALCAAGSSLNDDTRFQAIDCSNVGDHAGLMNVLLAVGPRLVPHPRSRIHMDTMTWTNGGATSLPAYLSKSFGGSASLLPTFTGLRLCSETRFGKLEPYSLHDMFATRSSNTRQLQFAPAVASTQAALLAAAGIGGSCVSVSSCNSDGEGVALAVPSVRMPPVRNSSGSSSSSKGQHSLEDGLLQLESICCLHRSVVASGATGCDTTLQTTATLARLIAAACVSGHMRLDIPSSSSSSNSSGSSDDGCGRTVWQQLAEVARLWPLQQLHQLAWRASWHWLLQAAPDPAPAPAVAAAAAAAAAVAPQQRLPRPVVFTGFMQPRTITMAARMSPTPELAVVLITDAAAVELMSTDVFGDGNSMMNSAGMQFAMAQFANTLGGGRMRMYPAFMHAAGLWAQGRADRVPAGVHLLDNIVVEPHPQRPMQEPMKVCFLLPADHGLNPQTTWVGLVQQVFGCLQCLPSQLSEFDSAPLLAPSPLLLTQEQQPAGAVAGRVAARGEAHSSTGAAKQQQQQQQQLELVELQETTTSYTAIIKLAHSNSSSSSSSQCSGLKPAPVSMVAGEVAGFTAKGPTHEIVLYLAQPAGVAPFRLRLLHPVQSRTAEYKLARSSGTITVRLVKLPDPDWPCDLNPPMGLGLLQRQRVDQLPALPMGALTQWGMWMTEMFTHAENAVKVHDPAGGQLGDPFFDLRETLKILFICTVNGETVYRMVDKEAAPGSDDHDALYIRVHTPIFRQPNGRPAAIVSVTDNVLGNKLVTDGKIDRQMEIQRFMSIIQSQIKGGNLRICVCSRRELALLRLFLLRNSRRMQPTPWQQKHLGLGHSSCWFASYITPVYPEHLGDSDTFLSQLTPNRLERFEQESRAAGLNPAPGATGSARIASDAAGRAASMGRGAASSGSCTGMKGSGSSSRSRAGHMASAAAVPAAGGCASGPSSSRSCRVCGIRGGEGVAIMRCSRCKGKSDWYCSRDCQKADWARHKKSCQAA